MATLLALVGGGMLARRPDQTGSGTAQRAMLVAALGWYPLAGITASTASQ